MKITGENGFYKFYPDDAGDLEVWESLNTKLTPYGDCYTFPELAEVEDYSFIGWPIGLNLATTNYAGTPDEVLRENNLTYSLSLKSIVNKNLIIGFLTLYDGITTNSAELPQLYSINGFERLKAFSCYWDKGFNIYKFERLDYESILSFIV